MALNLNIEPFFDDYSKNKKFYRILFRPGYAVQARELTQLQTILQEQIKRHGDHMFKNGAMIIPGQISYDSKTSYVKVDANTVSTSAITTSTSSILPDVNGKIYVGQTSGVQAIILTSTKAEVVNNTNEPNTLFVKYIRGGSTFNTFQPGEIITPLDQLSGLDLRVLTLAQSSSPIGYGTTASIQEGIYYIKDNFVFVESQTIVVTKYSNSPSARIGLQVNESVVYPEDDESLLDNALGSPNYAAPGAARYTIELKLISKSYDSTVDSDEFITLLTLKDGVVQFLVDKTQYAEIEKTLARRTFDESGDYTVRDFPIELREYRNNDRGTWATSKYYLKGDIVTNSNKKYKSKQSHTSSSSAFADDSAKWLEDTSPSYNYGLYEGPTALVSGSVEAADVEALSNKISLAVEPGKAYVRGYEIEKIVTQYLTIDKARTASSYELKSIDSSPGNYIIIKNTNYLPDINTDVTFYDRYGPAGEVPSVQAIVTATIANGAVTGFTITNAGAGYTSAPTVTLSAPPSGGTQATATATISAGSITSLTITNAGAGYTSAPTVTLSAPPSAVPVATARIKQIQLHSSDTSGNPVSYKVFLFRLTVFSGKDFARDAKYLYSNTNSTVDDPKVKFSARIVPTLIQLTGSLAASSIATITGVNTTFTQDLKVGDYVSINSADYRVTVITSNTSITVDGTPNISAGTFIYRVAASINSPNKLKSYFEFPAYAVKSTKNAQYSFYKEFKTGDVNVYTTSAETDYVFGTQTDNRNYIVVDEDTGNHLTLISSGNPTATQYKITNDNTTAVTFTFGTTSVFKILACLRRENTEAMLKRTKSLKNNTETNKSLTNGSLTLEKADAFELISVTTGTLTNDNWVVSADVTSKFKLDNGARSSHYELASISLLPNQSVSGNIQVTYSYFDQGATGDFYVVDSYLDITYEELPSDRANVIDFRPVINSSGEFSSIRIPKYGEETDIYYDYYLPRIDKLSLTSNGEYVLTKGIPDVNAKIPSSPSDSMDLYTFSIEPYTFSGNSSSVIPNKIENKRYTMRDIGKLENRINNLEYYTTLSLLEQNTVNYKSYDNYGFERPQNGFIVDDFTGQGIGNVSSADWIASIDSRAGELRPFFKSTNISLLESTTNFNRTALNYEVNGDLATLPIINKIPLVSQLRASHNESVNPFNIFVFNGSLEIIPWNDDWIEVNRRPDIIINDTKQYDAVVAKAEADGVLGTVYKSWSINWGGETVISRETQSADRRFGDGGSALDAEFGIGPEADGWAFRQVSVETVARTGVKTYTGGINTFIKSSSTDKVINDKLVSTELIPYMRKRKILFRGESLKPNTKMYAFFDDINVNSHITPSKKMAFTPYPATSAVPKFQIDINVGSNVNNAKRKTSDGDVSTAYLYGEVLTEYRVDTSLQANNPNAITETGASCVVVGQETVNGVYYVYIDNLKGPAFSQNTTQYTYYLQAEFDPSRKIQMTASGVVTPSQLTTTDTGQLFGTFDIPDSTQMRFRTGIRNFRFTDDSANIRSNSSTSAEATYTAKGILEIRERTILSTKTAEVVTERVPDKTEAIVQTARRVVSDTGWYDPLAQTFLVDLEGGAFITDVDLFFSAKDTNVPVKIHIRNVVNGYPGPSIVPFSEVILQPDEVSTSNNGSVATKFKFRSPVYLQNGVEYALVIISDSAKYRVWIAQAGSVDVAGSGLISSQPYAGVLFKSQNASTWTAEQNQDLKFVINRAVFNTNVTGTMTLVNQHVNNDFFYDLVNVNINNIVLPETKISTSLTYANTITDIDLGEDILLSSQRKLKDRVEEGNTSSFVSTVKLTSTKNNVSPVVDLSRCSAVLVGNSISLDETDEIYPEKGDALAKYATKLIKLNSSSTNLRILFDANIPNDAIVDVYYRTGLQSSDFSLVNYTKIPVTSYSKPVRKTENYRQFVEVEAKLDLPEFDIMQAKIVLRSSNTSKVPRVKALRVIAYA